MDSVGEAAFDFQFGALQNTDNEFMKAYLGLMYAFVVLLTIAMQLMP
jgi:hypothetical protein